MKRLSGWDAVLLYSETPGVHMHTLKVAVIELDPDRRDFGIDEFRRVIHSRLYKLEPFCYQLVDIPLKLHHPMWRENCDVDLTYHVRPWRLPAVGDVFRRRVGRQPDRGGRQDPPRARRRGGRGESAGARHGSRARAAVRPDPVCARPGAVDRGAGAVGIR